MHTEISDFLSINSENAKCHFCNEFICSEWLPVFNATAPTLKVFDATAYESVDMEKLKNYIELNKKETIDIFETHVNDEYMNDEQKYQSNEEFVLYSPKSYEICEAAIKESHSPVLASSNSSIKTRFEKTKAHKQLFDDSQLKTTNTQESFNKKQMNIFEENINMEALIRSVNEICDLKKLGFNGFEKNTKVSNVDLSEICDLSIFGINPNRENCNESILNDISDILDETFDVEVPSSSKKNLGISNIIDKYIKNEKENSPNLQSNSSNETTILIKDVPNDKSTSTSQNSSYVVLGGKTDVNTMKNNKDDSLLLNSHQNDRIQTNKSTTCSKSLPKLSLFNKSHQTINLSRTTNKNLATKNTLDKYFLSKTENKTVARSPDKHFETIIISDTEEEIADNSKNNRTLSPINALSLLNRTTSTISSSDEFESSPKFKRKTPLKKKKSTATRKVKHKAHQTNS